MSNDLFFSIIIINYNGHEFIENCLRSVLSSSYANFEVIVFDNASADDSLKIVSQYFNNCQNLKIIKSKTNLGFARANNEAAKLAKGSILVFLNVDTKVDKDWLFYIFEAIETDQLIGAGQCKLKNYYNPEIIDSAGHYIDKFGLVHVLGDSEIDIGQFDKNKCIFAATGAAFVCKKSVFEKVNGFDNDFFMFFEETDLCWRIWLAGYKIIFIPQAVVYHARGGIRKACKKDKIAFDFNYFFIRNRISSLIKNYGLKNLFFFLPMNILISLIWIAPMVLIRFDFKSAKSIIHGVAWNLLNFKKNLKKRMIVQKQRKVTDKYLFDNDLIKNFSIASLLQKI